MSMRLIKIPQRFYDDHVERDLPAPDVVRETSRHYWIDAESEHLQELLNDAEFYASHIDMPHLFGLCRSAAATAGAIRKS